MKRILQLYRRIAYSKHFEYTKFLTKGKVSLYTKPFFFHHGLAFKNTFDEIFLNNIYAFKKEKENPLIIDCGANMGLSVLYFSKNYTSSRIMAFEPDASVLPYLKRNIAHQGLKNVELFEKGVWIEEGSLNFYTDRGLGGRINTQYNNQKATTINTVRLKDFLDEKVDMLKLDIEGAEFDVLKDCKNSLGNVNNIFVEYHSVSAEEQHLDDILLILKNAGFRYHLKESFSQDKPFIDKKIICQRFDMAINIFAFRNND